MKLGSYAGTVLWSCVEVNVAVMSACLPTLGPVLQGTFRLSFIVRMLGSQETKVVRDDRAVYTFNRSPRSELGEEFQRLPEYHTDGLSGPDVHCTYNSPIRFEQMALGERTRKGVSAKTCYAT